GCHHQGGQSPMFARSDDINAAYQAALPLVNVQQPDQSTLVLRVASGHNCWVADTTACSSEMLTWIKAWLGTSAASNTSAPLTPPTTTSVTGTKQFPANATDSGTATCTPPTGSTDCSFKTLIYPMLSNFCSGCHAPNAASPQTPFFAQGGTPGYSDCT